MQRPSEGEQSGRQAERTAVVAGRGESRGDEELRVVLLLRLRLLALEGEKAMRVAEDWQARNGRGKGCFRYIYVVSVVYPN